MDHEEVYAMNALSPDTKAMLEALKAAVEKALECKKRLGQYAVIWSGDKPEIVGDDAPQERAKPRSIYLVEQPDCETSAVMF